MSRPETQTELNVALAELARTQTELANATAKIETLEHKLNVRLASLPGTTQELVAAYYRNAEVINELLAERDATSFERHRQVSTLQRENAFLHTENQKLQAKLAGLLQAQTPEANPESRSVPFLRGRLFASALKQEQGTQTEPTATAPTTSRRRR